MLGGVGLFHAQLFDQSARRLLSRAQKLQNRDAGGVSQGLKKLRFKAPEFCDCGFIHSTLRIYEYLQFESSKNLVRQWRFICRVDWYIVPVATLRYRLGSTLATVLIVATLVLAVGLALASTAVFNLNAGQSAVNLKQAELAARAAISQFVHDSASLGDSSRDVISPESGLVTPALRAFYETHPVLFRSDDPEVTVDVQFDPGREHYSTDNSRGTSAAAGWNRQVPAFSVYLVLRVRCSKLTRYFGVLLQRGWPYACTAVAPIRIGVPRPDGGIASSIIKGNLFAYSDGILPVPSLPNPDFIALDQDLYGPSTLGHFEWANGVSVDGPESELRGNVDTEGRDTQPVRLENGSHWVGRTRANISTTEQLRDLMRILAFPQPPASAVNLSSAAAAYLSAPVDAGAGATPSTARLFTQDVLRLGSSPSSGIPVANYYTLNENGGNRCIGYRDYNALRQLVRWQDPVRSPAAGRLVLNNCVLHVRGSLDFQGRSAAGFTLDGNNSTLIVEGTLTLEDAALNSGSQGLVILCRNLVLSGRGNFRGLLLARNSAIVICRDQTSQPLIIEGGIVCGNDPAKYALYNPAAAQSVAGPDTDAEAAVTTRESPAGLQLAGTKITYNPRFMRGLNGAGEFRVVGLQCL
jgi:hypothetical protein